MNLIAPLGRIFRGRTIRARVPNEFRRRYRDLYAARVERMPDGGERFGRGRAWRVGRLNVLSLAGDPFEMAFQHGRLLKSAIAQGGIWQASWMVRNAIRNSVGNRLISSLVHWYVDRWIARSILRTGLSYQDDSAEVAAAEAYGLSEGCGMPVDAIVRASLGPETLQVLLGRLPGSGGGGTVGCTSFAAWGTVTRDGEMILGRNTDYPLNGYYDVHPTVIYFQPASGQRFMTITSAGFHIAGVCGMNESGLFLGAHTVPAGGVSESGIPVFLLGQEILQRAGTLDEAAALATAARPAAGWNYHVVSCRERRAATFELGNKAVATRACRGETHVTTNHWTQPATRPFQILSGTAFVTDSEARKKRAQDLIEASAGSLDASAAAAILGDATDPDSGRQRCFPNTIAANSTVSSSVWRPDAGMVYVGEGTAPTSRGRFLTLPTPEFFDPERPPPLAFLEAPTGDGEETHLAEARQLLIASRMAFEYHQDAAAAADLLTSAAARFDDPALQLAWAMMEIRAGRFERAERPAHEAAQQSWDPRTAVVARYLRGRLAAHRGGEDTGRADFRSVQEDSHADPRLKDAARKAEQRLSRRARLRLRPIEIEPMGWLPDAFRYWGRF